MQPVIFFTQRVTARARFEFLPRVMDDELVVPPQPNVVVNVFEIARCNDGTGGIRKDDCVGLHCIFKLQGRALHGIKLATTTTVDSLRSGRHTDRSTPWRTRAMTGCAGRQVCDIIP